MKFQNTSKKQHYISRVEQRLNTSTPNSPKRYKRIYSFKIIDRELYSIEMEGNKAKTIENTLSWQDLFTFDVTTKAVRNNLEFLFNEYESNIEIQTINLIKNLEKKNNNIKEDLIGLFILKLLNTFRNPYCIKKTLNTVGRAAMYKPLSSDLAEIFHKIEHGNKPHQQWLCSELGITQAEYVDWLRTLLMLLIRPEENLPNMLEQIVKSLYETNSQLIKVYVYYYEDKYNEGRGILLSDRGFCVPLISDNILAYNFNLSSRAFITYAFIDVDSDAGGKPPKSTIDLFNRFSNNVYVELVKDDLNALATYNRHTVYQSFKHVYCSNKVAYGL